MREKKEVEQAARRAGRRSEIIGWNQCTAIYKFLSHHYIMRRSVVFIVDSEFDSGVCKDIAMG